MSVFNTLVPTDLQQQHLIQSLEYQLVYQGKVRDTYKASIQGFPYEALLMVATDRISIFDFVLNATIPKKGEVLTALTHFWMTQVLSDIPNHLIQSSTGEAYRNLAHTLHKTVQDINLKRTLLIRKIEMQAAELIFRMHIGGSVWKKYQEGKPINGIILPENLQKWSALEEPLFTPTTKAEQGHDKPIATEQYYDMVDKTHGQATQNLFQTAYKAAYKFASNAGILILDTKLEGNHECLGDEIFTPDSSRFVLKKDLDQALSQGQEPPFFDKEQVRIWGKKQATPFFNKNDDAIIGIHRLNPLNQKHRDFVHDLIVPEKILEQTTKKYQDLFQILTGSSLEDYQERFLL